MVHHQAQGVLVLSGRRIQPGQHRLGKRVAGGLGKLPALFKVYLLNKGESQTRGNEGHRCISVTRLVEVSGLAKRLWYSNLGYRNPDMATVFERPG